MSDEFLGESSATFARLEMSFQAIKLIENEFIPTMWYITVDIDPADEIDYDDVEIKNVFKKVRYWIEQIVSGSIIFSNTNKWAKKVGMLRRGRNTVGNNLFLMPEQTGDNMLARLIHAKINALADNVVFFPTIEIGSDDGLGLSFLYSGDPGDKLPTMSEWMGQDALFKLPWWHRNDGSTFDSAHSITDKMPDYFISLDFLNEQIYHAPRPKAQILRPNFQLKVITGGKGHDNAK